MKEKDFTGYWPGSLNSRYRSMTALSKLNMEISRMTEYLYMYNVLAD